jgi:hypothetical protein
MIGLCKGHVAVMETLTPGEIEEYMWEVFHSSRVVTGWYLEQPTSKWVFAFVKGSMDLLKKPADGTEEFMLQAIFVDDADHADLMKLAYELRGEDARIPGFCTWQLSMPYMEDVRRDALAEAKRLGY